MQITKGVTGGRRQHTRRVYRSTGAYLTVCVCESGGFAGQRVNAGCRNAQRGALGFARAKKIGTLRLAKAVVRGCKYRAVRSMNRLLGVGLAGSQAYPPGKKWRGAAGCLGTLRIRSRIKRRRSVTPESVAAEKTQGRENRPIYGRVAQRQSFGS